MGLIVWYTLNLISINSLCTSRRFVEMMEEVATVICTLTYHKYANDVNGGIMKEADLHRGRGLSYNSYIDTGL